MSWKKNDFLKKIKFVVMVEVEKQLSRVRALCRLKKYFVMPSRDWMNLPSNRFEALSGDRKGQYSISINMQWGICFEWIDNEPHNVEIVAYH